MIEVPKDLQFAIEKAWQAAREIPGYLNEDEARFLAMAAACAPRTGRIIEIGSFKGRSTVLLASIAKHYDLPPVVAIDPHTMRSEELLHLRTAYGNSTLNALKRNLHRNRLTEYVDIQCSLSADVALNWKDPIADFATLSWAHLLV